MSTDDELARLEADQLPPKTRIWVTHRFSHFHSSESERDSFREALRASRFGPEIGSDEESSGDGYWHHWSFTALSATPDALKQADAQAQQVAEAHAVRYDGFQVQREVSDYEGPPRLADKG